VSMARKAESVELARSISSPSSSGVLASPRSGVVGRTCLSDTVLNAPRKSPRSCRWARHRWGTKVLTSDDQGQLSAYDGSTNVEGVRDVNPARWRCGMSNEIGVGLDDSPSGKAALNWAAEQARSLGTTLRAAHALDWPYGLSSTGFPAPLNYMDVSPEEIEDSLRWSRSAAVLVVGHPHRRGWWDWTRSVARSVMRQTHCPIVAPQAMAESGRNRELADQALT
jgi:hypothetical protein